MSDELPDLEEEMPPPSSRLPALDFSTFLMSIIGSALVHLGEAPYPGGQSLPPNLILAQQDIDLLTLLQMKNWEKSKFQEFFLFRFFVLLINLVFLDNSKRF